MRILQRSIFITVFLAGVTCVAFSQSPAQEAKPGTGVISGRVTIAGNPARGVTVMAVRENTDPAQVLQLLTSGGLSEITLKAKTDEEGRYRFSEVAAAHYRVFAHAPSMVGVRSSSPAKDEPAKKPEPAIKKAPLKKSDPTEDEDDEDDEEKAPPPAEVNGPQRYIELGEGQTVENVNFALARGGVITGRVTYADGRPVIGQIVTVAASHYSQDQSTFSLGIGSENFMTDDRGVYRVYGLPDGGYKVSLEVRGNSALAGINGSVNHKRTYYPGVTDEAGATSVEVTAGGEVRGIDIKLGAAAKTFVVIGRVVETDTGKPVPNVTVVFERARNSGNDGNSEGFTEANAKGEFRFENVAPGAYQMLTVDGLVRQSDFYGEPSKFEVKDRDLSDVVLKVKRGATIGGVVVLEGASDPQTLAKLSQQTLSAMTGMDRKGDDQSDGAAGKLEDGLEGFSIAQSPIATDGSFLLKGLRAGAVQIGMGTFLADSSFAISRIERGGVEVQGALELRPNENISDLRIVAAQKNCVLRGQVRVEGGSLPKTSRIQVTARRVNHNPSQALPNLMEELAGGSTQVDANGQFKFDGLIPGEYEVIVTLGVKLDLDNDDPRPPTAKQNVFVTSDREAEVMFVLNPKTRK